MTKKQKRTLRRILVSGAVFLGVQLLPLEGIPLLLASLVPYLIIGHDVLRKAARNICNGQVFDENFLMAVATVGAFGCGEYAEGTAVMLFYQVGELFQSVAVGKSRRSIAQLMSIRPDSATVERGGQLVQTDPEEVAVGSIILIRPGERVPLDGTVVDGISTLDTAALTGESLPRDIAPGQEIVSGCVNLSGVLRVRVSRPYSQSTVAKILELVETSTEKKAKAEHFITKFARYYTPAVVFAALAVAFLPPLLGQGRLTVWIHRALVFLVVSCPCALVISIPLTFFGGIGGASRRGILVKGGNYLEALAEAEIAVFDKTGTLTRGEFTVTHICPQGVTDEELLTLAALAEQFSSHPVAGAIRAAAPGRSDLSRACEVREIAGQGIRALVDGREVLVGSAALMAAHRVPCPAPNETGTVVHVARDGQWLGHLVAGDLPRPAARQALEELKAAGIKKTVMLTGDSPAVGQAVGGALGLDLVYAGLLPADKVARVEELLEEKTPGKQLLFVGDGINDAPVLARADVGVAMGAMGSDAAIEAADIVLMEDDLTKLAQAVRIARKTKAIVRQNIVFALGVKFLVLALAPLGLANMWLAVFADVGVCVIAILNAGRTLKG